MVVYRPPSLAHPVGAALTLPAGGALATTAAADAFTFFNYAVVNRRFLQHESLLCRHHGVRLTLIYYMTNK